MSEGNRELELWLAEHLLGMQLRDIDEYHCEMWCHAIEEPAAFVQPAGWRTCSTQGTHYTTTDWERVAEAMRQKGWLVHVKLWPDNVPIYIGDPPHRNMPPVFAEMEWFGHHCQPEIEPEKWLRRDGYGRADTPDQIGLAVCRAAKEALEGGER